MWHIRVQYTNKRYDIVPDTMLDQLILSEKIIRFYHPPEQRWIASEMGPVWEALHHTLYRKEKAQLDKIYKGETQEKP